MHRKVQEICPAAFSIAICRLHPDVKTLGVRSFRNNPKLAGLPLVSATAAFAFLGFALDLPLISLPKMPIDDPNVLLKDPEMSRDFLNHVFGTTPDAEPKPADAKHLEGERRDVERQPTRGVGPFALQHAPPAPEHAQGGLQPRPASASFGQLADVFPAGVRHPGLVFPTTQAPRSSSTGSRAGPS